MAKAKEKLISIVAPVYNEIDCLDELYKQINTVMKRSGKQWELVLVDDGSQDGSTDKSANLQRRINGSRR